MRDLRALKDLVRSGHFQDEMLRVFFKALLSGYAGTAPPKKSTIAELPGSTVVTHPDGPWTVVDYYFTTPLGNRSGGTTMIWYDGVPVWMMSYFGEYEESALPCLKAALRATYEGGQFIGGRGPVEFSLGDYSYHNTGDRGIIDHFSGEEWIDDLRDGTRRRVGWHCYHGGMMV